MGTIEINKDLPIGDAFDYRDHLYSLILDYVADHALKVCQELPKEEDLPKQFQVDSLWKDDETQTWIVTEMKLMEKISKKVVDDMNTPDV